MKAAGRSLVTSAKRAGHKHLLSAMMLAAAALTVPHAAQAQSQASTATVSGTMSSGIDTSGVFGTPGRNLAGLGFSVVFSFDGGMGNFTQTFSGGNLIKTEIQDNSGSMSPGSAVISLGGGSYAISQSTGSIDYRVVPTGSSAIELDVANNGNGNSTHVIVSGGPGCCSIPPWTSDANYFDAFSYSPATGVTGSFTIYGPNGSGHDSASGVFSISSVTISGGTTTSNAKTFGGPNCDCSASGPNAATSGTAYTIGSTQGQPFVGEPINLATGNIFRQETDYTTAGENPLTFKRYYNSLGNTAEIAGVNIITYATSMGTNWRSNYDRYLQLGSSTVNAERPDGQILTFTLQGSTWTPDTDTDYTLTNSGTTWTLTDHNDTVETYTTISGGAYAQLNSIALRNGYTQTMTYNGSNQLTTVTDSYSRSLTLSYSGSLLQSVATPDSTTISYGYTAAGASNVLSSVSYPTTPASGFTYNYTDASFPFALTSIVDGLGQTYASWTYDSSGRATSSEFGSGANQTTVAYNSDGSRTVTNALGVADTYSFTSMNGVWKMNQISRAATSTTAAATENFYYDRNGYLSTFVDWKGNTTSFTNNAHGDPTTVNYAVGSTVAYSVTISYDTTFVHLPHQIVAPGLTSTFGYDTSGNLLNRTDTDTTTTSTPYSTNGQTRQTQWTWNSTGEMLSVQLPRTDVTATTSFTYATDGALTQITDALSHNTQITSHTGGGYPLTIVDPNSVTTTLTYTGLQKLATSTLATTAGNLVTTWSYDAAQNLASVEKPDSSTLSYGYDTAHRLTSITDLIGNSITYTLDALGDPTATTWKDPSSTTTKSTSATFDALGRMLTFVGGMGQTTTYTYDKDSNVATIKDPIGNTVTNTWDALNRLSKVQDPSPGGTTTYTYNAFNHVLSVKDPNTHTTSYVYDGFGDRIQIASPDAGTSTYYYDKDRNVTQINLPGSMTANLTYDVLDRWLTTSYPSDSTLNVSNTYDQTTGHGFGIGRLTSTTDKPGSLSLSFDERGNVTYESRTVTSAGTLNTTTAYDAASNVSSISYPSGTVVDYSRDSMGKVTAVTAKPPGAGSFSNVATSITYEPFGPVTGVNFGNGITGAYAFDNDYRPTTRVDGATTNVLGLSYGYNANDNVTGITDSVNSANSQTLGYDALNRLNSAVSGTGGYGTWSWTWDAGSNVSTQVVNGTTTTFSLTSGTNKLSQWAGGGTTETVTNTNAGNINLLKIGGTTVQTLTYNQANEMASAQGTTFASYVYDLTGQRLEKSPSGSYPILYQYGRTAGELLSENDLHSGQTADYIYLNGRPVGEVNPTTGAIYFMHTDRLGTVDTVTDGSKNVVWNATYQPFGSNGIGSVTGTLGTQSVRLPGQYFDPETGYNHNGFRDYAGGLTRYVEADPMGIGSVAGKQANDINIYQYVKGNAFRFTDTRGLQEGDPFEPLAPIQIPTPQAGRPPYPYTPAPQSSGPLDIIIPKPSEEKEFHEEYGKTLYEQMQELEQNPEELKAAQRECTLRRIEQQETQQKQIEQFKKAPYCTASDPKGLGPGQPTVTNPKPPDACSIILGLP